MMVRISELGHLASSVRIEHSCSVNPTFKLNNSNNTITKDLILAFLVKFLISFSSKSLVNQFDTLKGIKKELRFQLFLSANKKTSLDKKREEKTWKEKKRYEKPVKANTL